MGSFNTTILPGAYLFTWEAEGITLRLYRLKERGEYLTAQIEVLDGGAHLYGADRLTLVSGESRLKMAKAKKRTTKIPRFVWGLR